MLQITITPNDTRYRMMVTLIRSDRPKYWNWLCNNCGAKVGELDNVDVFDITDFYDPADLNNRGFTKHCKGTESSGMPCQFSYFFNFGRTDIV